MKSLLFAQRVAKELYRDPLSLFFGIGFPLILLGLLTIINNSIPVDLFNIARLAPGIALFGVAFIALFAAQTLAKDRETLLLLRLYTTTMKAHHFIVGYALPLLMISIVQALLCLLAAIPLGLPFTWHSISFLAIVVLLALFYISFGLLCGTLFSEKAAAALCGAVLTNVSGWLSGIWFDISLIGGLFEKIAYTLPFVHAVELGEHLINGQYNYFSTHIWWIAGYSLTLTVIAIYVFAKKSREAA